MPPPDSSTVFNGVVQQTDGRVERRRTHVHVALRRPEILVAGELLNRPRRRATHREMRTERVSQALSITSAVDSR
jgi:hypothetical protein